MSFGIRTKAAVSRETGTRKVKPLPKAATAAVVEYLQSKAPDFACPACKEENFVVYNHLTAIPAVEIASGNFMSEFYPSILTVCSNCGFAMQFVPPGKLLEKLTLLAAEASDE